MICYPAENVKSKIKVFVIQIFRILLLTPYLILTQFYVIKA